MRCGGKGVGRVEGEGGRDREKGVREEEEEKRW